MNAHATPRRTGPALAAALATLWGLGGALALTTEPPPDVTYYAAWAAHPALGYLDHPGAVAWALIPWGEARWLGVRLLPLLLMSAQTWAALQCAAATARLDPDAPAAAHLTRPALWAALAAAPLAIAGAALWTPDIPFTLGWTLGLWAAHQLITCAHPTQTTQTARWGALLCAGAALMVASKASGLAAAALLCGAAARHAPRAAGARRWLLAALVIAALTFALTCLPSVAFQAARLGAPWRLRRLLAAPVEALGGWLLVAGPGLWWAVTRGVKALRAPAQPPPSPSAAFWRDCGAGWLLLWLAIGFKARIEVNWLAPAALPWTLWAVTRASAPHHLRRWAAAQVAVSALLVLQAATALLPLGAADPTRHLRGWRAWAASLPTAGASLVLADRYQWAAQAAWHLPSLTPATLDALSPGAAKRPSALDPWACPHAHARALLLTLPDAPPNPPAAFTARWPWRCASVEVTAPPNAGPPPRLRAEVWSASPCDPTTPCRSR